MSAILQGLKLLDDNIQSELEQFMRLYVLLYADDTIILAETAEDLLQALNGLNSYCQKWSLKTNVSETKIVIFSKRKVTKFPNFFLDAEEIDVKDDCIYLGVTFNFNVFFKNAIDKLVTQARKAMFALLKKSRILCLPVDIVCNLFDVCVVPILLYGTEVRRFENLNPS